MVLVWANLLVGSAEGVRRVSLGGLKFRFRFEPLVVSWPNTSVSLWNTAFDGFARSCVAVRKSRIKCFAARPDRGFAKVPGWF
jgi:hypothetical protein